MITLSFAGILLIALMAHLSGRSTVSDGGVVARVIERRASLLFVFAATFGVLWYSWAAVNPIPVVHDEMAYVLQAQIFARGMWALPAPPIPLFWEQLHVLVEPAVASKYFPGHSLVMTLGALVGWPALVPLVLQSTIAVLLFVLARRVASSAVALMAWLVWLFSPMVLYFGPSYYSEATTTACWLAGWYALLEWRTNRRMRWLMAAAFFTGWDAITRPLTGLAYAIPMVLIVLWDVLRGRRWRDLAYATIVGVCVIAILPLWSARTTGNWMDTPLAHYTRMYMPFDVPGFGLKAVAPEHYITPQLAQWNIAYSRAHVNHVPSRLFAELRDRSRYLWINIWGVSSGVLGLFALLGLLTMNASVAFAVGSSVFLLLVYLSFGTPAEWTLYYYESVPAYAFLCACGFAWVASWIGRPARVALSPAYDWRSPRWTRALAAGAVALVLPGLVALQMLHRQHISDRRALMSFDALLSSIHDARAVVFVRYSATHSSNVAFVRNSPDPAGERIWVVYDLGERENARLLRLAPDRTAYLFDEQHGRTYAYDPRAIQ